MLDLPKDKKIILFDGVCNLCNATVIKIIKYDTKNQFVLTAIQSDIGNKIINYLKIDTTTVDSVILYEPNVSFDIKSTAALKIMNQFGGFWKLANVLFLCPKFLRDKGYDIIAKNRYKWFGKQEVCMLPNKDLEKKFI